jgi:hypothetical protein
VFLVESRHTTLHNHTLRVNINIQSKKKRNFQKNYQTRRHFTFNIIKVCYLVYLQEYAMYVRLNFAIFNLTSISMYNTPCVDINTSYVEIQNLMRRHKNIIRQHKYLIRRHAQFICRHKHIKIRHKNLIRGHENIIHRRKHLICGHNTL